MKFKAILFDLDNTLIDFMEMKRLTSEAAAKAMIDAGLKADKERISKELFDFYLEYGIESDDAFTRFLEKNFGGAEPRILAAGINAYLKEKYIHLKPYSCVVETLKELKRRGLKLGVVTDGLRLKVWMRLNEARLDKYFDVVVTFDDTGKKKPVKEPFMRACEELGVNPQECLMVGDWPERDVAGAKEVGMKTCWAKYGSHKEKGNADYTLETSNQVLEVINDG